MAPTWAVPGLFKLIATEWMKNLKGSSPWRSISVQLLGFSGTVEENTLTL